MTLCVIKFSSKFSDFWAGLLLVCLCFPVFQMKSKSVCARGDFRVGFQQKSDRKNVFRFGQNVNWKSTFPESESFHDPYYFRSVPW